MVPPCERLHQVEVGFRDLSELDPDRVCNAFGWEVQRIQGQAKFVTEAPGPIGTASAIVLPITSRASIIEGGKIKIVTEVKYAALPPVKDFSFGVDDGVDAKTNIDGSGAIRVE